MTKAIVGKGKNLAKQQRTSCKRQSPRIKQGNRKQPATVSRKAL